MPPPYLSCSFIHTYYIIIYECVLTRYYLLPATVYIGSYYYYTRRTRWQSTLHSSRRELACRVTRCIIASVICRATVWT